MELLRGCAACRLSPLVNAMQPVLNREQMRHYDALAVSEGKLPGIVLMENAGRGAATLLQQLIAQAGQNRCNVLIVCGPGNNGGDGYVVARHLLAGHTAQASVRYSFLPNVHRYRATRAPTSNACWHWQPTPLPSARQAGRSSELRWPMPTLSSMPSLVRVSRARWTAKCCRPFI